MNPIQSKLTAILIPLLFTLLSHQTARAYYDPGVQRWINRDPLADQGLFILRLQSRRFVPVPIVERTEGPNLYSIVSNDPENAVDPIGTFSIRMIPFPCPNEFLIYCMVACAQQGMTPNPKCSFSRIGGHWYIEGAYLSRA